VVPPVAILLLGDGGVTVSKDRKQLSAVGDVVRVKLPELHSVLIRRLRECCMSVLGTIEYGSTSAISRYELSDILWDMLKIIE